MAVYHWKIETKMQSSFWNFLLTIGLFIMNIQSDDGKIVFCDYVMLMITYNYCLKIIQVIIFNSFVSNIRQHHRCNSFTPISTVTEGSSLNQVIIKTLPDQVRFLKISYEVVNKLWTLMILEKIENWFLVGNPVELIRLVWSFVRNNSMNIPKTRVRHI